MQEVLLRVRRGLHSYRPGSFDGWLWRITRNAFLDDVRRRQRRPTVPLPETREPGEPAPGADEVLAGIRLSEDIQAALLDLPFDFREVVVMYDIVGLTYEEIAEIVEIPIGTVRSRIHRGRRMLREKLT